jgi:hypothetical protein
LIYPAGWRDNGGSLGSAASGSLPSGNPGCNNGSEDDEPEKSARNPSADKFYDQDDRRRLDSLAIFGNAEVMGPRGGINP